MINEIEANDTLETAHALNLGLQVGAEQFVSVSGALTVTAPTSSRGLGTKEHATIPSDDSSIPNANETGIVAGTTDSVFANNFLDRTAAGAPGADVEFFKVSAAAGQVITLQSPARGDPVVLIYDAEGNLLAFNDDDVRLSTLSSFLQYVVPEDGDYYVAIQSAYTYQADPFDSESAVSSIQDNVGTFAPLYITLSTHDFDFFSFTLEEGQVFSTAVSGAGANLMLVDPDGVVVGYSDANQSSNMAEGSLLPNGSQYAANLTELATKSGTYTLRVSSSESTEYSLDAGVFWRSEITEPIVDASPFLVNTEIESDQIGAKIAKQADGTYAAIWLDFSAAETDPDRYDIKFQLFDADSQKIGNEKSIFDVDEFISNFGNQLPGYPKIVDFSLTPLADGRFLMAHAVTIYDEENAIKGRIISASGDVVSEDFILQPLAESVLPLDIAIVASSQTGQGFWYLENLGDPDGWTARSFDQNGQETGSPINFGFGDDRDPSLFELENGNLIFTHSTIVGYDPLFGVNNNTIFFEVRSQLYGADGTAIGPETTVQEYLGAPIDDPREHEYVELHNGNIAFVTPRFYQDGLSSDFGIRLFDSDLAPLNDITGFSTSLAYSPHQLETVALSDGGFAVAASFYNPNNGGPFGQIVVLIFNHDGSKRGNDLVVTEDLNFYNYKDSSVLSEFAATEVAGGNILLTWTGTTGEFGDASGTAVYSQIVDPGVGPGNYIGTDQDDVLFGHQFADVIDGGAGNDTIVGWFGADVLTGGDDADTFVFTSRFGGPDTITDFVSGEDKIEIGRKGFSLELVTGLLEEDDLVFGDAATTDQGQFLYNNATGTLSFDADGTGSGAAQVIAELGAGTALAHTDINVTTGGTSATQAGRLLLESKLVEADPHEFMHAIRDYDGNRFDASDDWILQGSVDVQNDGDLEYVFSNQTLGRWVTIGPDNNGVIDFDAHGYQGDTRVVGIYIDPLVADGTNEPGGPFDSQQRFQNDLLIDNLRLLGADDYDGDDFQEMYFRTVDGTAYLRALMHADGNVQYANYQSEQQMIDYFTSQGYDESTWSDWIV